MLNRYAKFSILTSPTDGHNSAIIDRAGRPFGKYYKHITNSSLKRLLHIDDAYLCKIIYNPHRNFYMYEYNPPQERMLKDTDYQCPTCFRLWD